MEYTHGMKSRAEKLRLAAEAVASEMRSPEAIRRGLRGITSLHSPELAGVVNRLYDVPQEVLDRVIHFEPRY